MIEISDLQGSCQRIPCHVRKHSMRGSYHVAHRQAFENSVQQMATPPEKRYIISLSDLVGGFPC